MYIFILCILIIFAIFDVLIKRNFFVYGSALLLALLAGLRGELVGVDTAAYVSDFFSVSKGFFNSLNSSEIGFVGLERAFACFHLPVWSFFIFISLVTFICLTYGYINMCGELAGLALAYYYSRFFVSRDFNQIRSSIVAAIVLASLKLIVDKKYLKFIIVILIGNLIHSGAWIALLIIPAYILLSGKLKKHLLSEYSFAVIILIFLSRLISPFLNRIAGSLGQASVYITSDFYTQGSGLSNPVIWMQIIICFVAIYFFLKSPNDKYYSIILTTYMLSTFILILFSEYRILGGRLSTIFATVEPVIVIHILNSLRLPKTCKYMVFITFTIIIFVLINYIGNLIPELYPYYFSV